MRIANYWNTAVCYVGEIGDKDLQPNPNEVAECFTVPLACLLDSDRWIHKKDAAPIFVGGEFH